MNCVHYYFLKFFNHQYIEKRLSSFSKQCVSKTECAHSEQKDNILPIIIIIIRSVDVGDIFLDG